MPRWTTRAWMVLVVVAVLAMMTSAAYAVTAPCTPNHAPDWWYDPLPGSTNMRMCWYTWDESNWSPPLGMTPDCQSWDFQPHPKWEPWEWSHLATNLYDPNIVQGGVEFGEGIRIVAGKMNQEINLSLANRQLHPYKLWYLELEFGDITPEDWERLKSGDMTVESLTFAKVDDSGADYLLPPEAWSYEEEPQWNDETRTWCVTYRIEPQPDYEKIVWRFDTDHDDPFDADFHITKVCAGTTCTPEPVSAALLLLGLPLGVLARRRRTKED